MKLTSRSFMKIIYSHYLSEYLIRTVDHLNEEFRSSEVVNLGDCRITKHFLGRNRKNNTFQQILLECKVYSPCTIHTLYSNPITRRLAPKHKHSKSVSKFKVQLTKKMHRCLNSSRNEDIGRR